MSSDSDLGTQINILLNREYIGCYGTEIIKYVKITAIILLYV